MLECREPAVSAAAQPEQTRYAPICPRCGGSGVQRRGESTYQRCDCAVGQTLPRHSPPQADDDAASLGAGTA